MQSLKQAEKSGNIFFLTIKTYNGTAVLLDNSYYQIILNSLKFCRANKGWKIYAYSVLINHIHLVLSVDHNFSLSTTIKDFKSFTGHEILKRLKIDKRNDIIKKLHQAALSTKDRNNRVWRRSSWPVTISSKRFFWQKVKYTDLNAQKHGIVEDIELYPYTSYHNHKCEHDVVMEIDDYIKLFLPPNFQDKSANHGSQARGRFRQTLQ